jgi:hypothetical protein
MQGPDGLLKSHPWGDQFAAAAEAGHQVLFDEAERNVKAG